MSWSQVIVVALVAGLGLFAATTVIGRPAETSVAAQAADLAHGWGHRWRGGDRPGYEHFCGGRLHDALDDGLAEVASRFRFTPAQAEAFARFDGALRSSASRLEAACESIKAEAATAAGGLAQARTMMSAGLEALDDVTPAFDAFRASLDDGQRAALDRLLERRHGRRWR